jgi:hypothetical protein
LIRVAIASCSHLIYDDDNDDDVDADDDDYGMVNNSACLLQLPLGNLLEDISKK